MPESSHRIRNLIVIIAILVTAGAVLAPARLTTADKRAGRAACDSLVRPRPADTFVDSIGVGAHIHYTDTVYDQFDTIVAPRLQELGVRHVRTGAYTYAGIDRDSFYYERLRRLGAEGIRFNLVTTIDTRWSDRTRVHLLDDIQRWTDGAVESFEGVNEPDLTGRGDWVWQARRLQRDIWASVADHDDLGSIDLVGPSTVWEPEELGDISQWVTLGNWHPYPGGICPTCTNVFGMRLSDREASYRTPTDDLPMVVSETGYHTAVAASSGQAPVSERAQAKYLPRLLLYFFNRRMKRTFIYELLDEWPDAHRTDPESNFGILRNDGSPKPAFRSLTDLIRLLEDPGPRFEPTPLGLTLGNASTVESTLLQKRDGTYYLALWRGVPSWDTGERPDGSNDVGARRDLEVRPRRVAVCLGATAGSIRLYRPGSGMSAQRSWTDVQRFDVDVPDEVVILEVRVEAARRPAARALTFACARAPTRSFRDVDTDDPQAPSIACINGYDVTSGTGAGTYRPRAVVQRWQMALFLDRVLGLGQRSGDEDAELFSDISSLPREQRQAIRRLRDVGVVAGTAGGRFAPFQVVTRGQMAAFVNRARRVLVGSATSGCETTDFFADDDGVHERDINCAASAGITDGLTPDRYGPHQPVRRGQMARFLARLLEAAVDDGAISSRFPPA